jgi:23S rRNA pseudouridine1911/1915/1917 synthase
VTVLIPPELEGTRADKAVAVLAGVSRSRARRWIEDGRVRVDGQRVAPSDPVAAGSRVEFPDSADDELAPEPVDFDVVYEDDQLLVVDKPPGLVVHPGAGRTSGTLAAGLLHRYPELEGVGEPGRWGIVHRLDKDTSGLLVVARTADAFGTLRRDLRARRIRRRYLALVTGTMPARRGTIDAPLGRDPSRPTRRAVVPDGKPAVTHYRVVEEWPDVSLLEVELETGRTHQIRVHLAAIGHPLVGDTVYGRPGPTRIFLHASGIELPHPADRRPLTFESPLPADLRSVLHAKNQDANR